MENFVFPNEIETKIHENESIEEHFLHPMKLLESAASCISFPWKHL